MGTQRTFAALEALIASSLADNQIGAITPAIARSLAEDLLETLLPARAGLHFELPALPTAIATPGTFVKAAGASTLDAENRFDHPTNNQVRYTGAANISVLLVATVSVTCASNNQTIGLAVAKNGTVQTSSITTTKLGTGSDVKAVPLVTDGQYDDGDYFEIWLTNYTSTAAVTVEHLHARIVGFMN